MVRWAASKRIVALLLAAAVVTSCGGGGEPRDRSSTDESGRAASANYPAGLRPSPTSEPVELEPGSVPPPSPASEPVDF